MSEFSGIIRIMTVPNSKMNLISPKPPKSFASFLILILVAITAPGWRTHRPGYFSSIDVMDHTLYLAGNFNMIGGASRDGLAAVDLATAELKPLNPAPNDAVNLVVCDAGGVFVGGDFKGLNTRLRTNIAIFKVGADEPLDLSIDLNGGKLFTIAVAGETMYIGGEFPSVNGVARRNLAAIDLESGDVLNRAPKVSGA